MHTPLDFFQGPVEPPNHSGKFMRRRRSWKRGSERRGSSPTLTSKLYRFLRVRSRSEWTLLWPSDLIATRAAATTP